MTRDGAPRRRVVSPAPATRAKAGKKAKAASTSDASTSEATSPAKKPQAKRAPKKSPASEAPIESVLDVHSETEAGEASSREASLASGHASRSAQSAAPKAPKGSSGKTPSPKSGAGSAASTSHLAAQAALDALASHGSAIDAVLAGFFAEAGNDPDVLFGPISAIVYGGGAGARAFDGRARQPGLGASRPRGTRDGDRIVPAARVAAPRSVQTAILLQTMYGRASLSDVTRRGVSDAKSMGATARADLLALIGRSGGAALSKSSVLDALLAVGGVAAGGALSSDDLTEARPGDVALGASASIGEAQIYRAPWGSQVPAAKSSTPSTTDVIVASDAWGLIALLSFERSEGLFVPDLEVSLPLSGIPVRRGVTRTSPGTVLPAAAPIVVVDRGASLRVAFGARLTNESDRRVLTPADVEPLATSTPVDPAVRTVARSLSTSVAAVAVEARGVRVISASEAAA